jgi:hypothetical protein
MKKIVSILLVLQSFTAFSQFSDNFSDGVFHRGQIANRAVDWQGNVDDFVVNDALQLQLNSPNNQSPAQLRTRSSAVSNTSWNFYVKMEFNPTASNYSRIYLVSDEADLNGDLNGLFIRIGHTNKNIALIQSEKGKNNRTLFQGTSQRLNLSSVAVNVRATLDDKGNFNLYSKLAGETDFTLEGSCILSEMPISHWFGIICNYTTTRNRLFFFDNFTVGDINDTSIEPEPEPEPIYDLPQQGEILFSEIMANPATGNPEYIELYNTTDKSFQLNDCVYYYGDRSFRLPENVIEPKSYFILCRTTETAWFNEGVNAVGVPSFPTLANTGRLLMLENKDGALISWFEYSDKMLATDKRGGGWSLECIDLANVANTAENWSASISESGETAGRENSIKASNPDTEQPKILSTTLLEDNKIEVSFSKPMNRLSLLDPKNYLIANSAYQIVELKTNYPQGTLLTIQINQFPPKGELLELQLNDIRDLSGNLLEEETSVILIGSAYEAESSDVIVNEILFNPPTGGNEYVEIYNRSNKILDLRFLSITSRRPSDGSFNRAYPLTTLPLFLYPKEYVVITRSQELVCNFFNCNDEAFFVEPEGMPSLANTGGCAVILNNITNEIVDEFYYQETMHSKGISNRKGVALERISFGKPTNENSNWASATDQSRYGTPGYLNSQHLDDVAIENINSNENKISIEYPFLNNENYGINYQLDKAGYNCRILIYDTVGRIVDTIVNNEILGSQGIIYWNGSRLSSGIYIVYMEVFDTFGNLHQFKTPIVLK